ncbi:class D sortase [Salisediminibacterium halotolerans]|uniref:Sortase A n=1 Tax=Salisediminibacterium halotolerans TaxID=517425 RepID=A0A1H9TN89_9BACI|nr:class D sortase [Salisediminibacterium haloalkalitolerans]SER98626.1 sortase A [Salisediminibacterium haloalkalitolerans]
MKKLGLLFLILGTGFLSYFYIEHESATAGVSALKDERQALDQEIEKKPLEPGDEIAVLKIPELEKQYKTYWGTDDETLDQGVGMHESEWTSTPDEKAHTLLSGHRDTVFRELGELQKGDQMIVIYNSVSYIYTINDIWITSAEDKSVVVGKNDATLTLSTCYPFYLLGDAPDRYIIQAELTESKSIAEN